jgi:benzoyl-CoA 2,3-epoxidase subunit A
VAAVTTSASTAVVIKQHLIDPEICIRCNTCEATCPVNAITHDDRNYVVDAEICNLCMACIAPCPTGSIDNWREMPRLAAYPLAEQMQWDELPPALSEDELAAVALAGSAATADAADESVDATGMASIDATEASVVDGRGVAASEPDAGPEMPPAVPSIYGSTLPPWSAAHAYTRLYGPKNPVTATVVGNVRVTEAAGTGQRSDYDTHHVVLDFGTLPFPVLEGQSIGIVPPGLDARGRPHHARQYSVASPRDGERPGYNNLSLTIKRVLEDHQGRPVRGVASNHVCDSAPGDTVQVVGPFGASFLMPNHPGSHIVMICTGTGSAPMRAMTEWRRRLRKRGPADGGRLLLFFGARTQNELPYFGPLQNLPKDFIDTHFAYSRTPGAPRCYVQDAMRERTTDLGALLRDPNSHFYVCGLKQMEEGVLLALRDIATGGGLHWPTVAAALKREGRLHLETY